jgi:hypothetical protein
MADWTLNFTNAEKALTAKAGTMEFAGFIYAGWLFPAHKYLSGEL